jgi:uncharacterized protein YheU (UPF0270 family)
MDIPWEELSTETLQALIEEYVSREGTDYGLYDFSLADKVGQVRLQLRNGQARIDFDPDSGTCHILPMLR